MYENRQSGKTFRHLCCAFFAASSGKNVVYFCNGRKMVDWTWNHACSKLKGWIEVEGYNLQQRTILFPGGGSIKIADVRDYQKHQRGRDVSNDVQDLD